MTTISRMLFHEYKIINSDARKYGYTKEYSTSRECKNLKSKQKAAKQIDM